MRSAFDCCRSNVTVPQLMAKLEAWWSEDAILP
jgi:hypothetical protein